MAIKSNLEKHTVNWLERKNADKLLNMDISIQRKEVWDHEKKSNLIASMLLDIPIESLLFEESEANVYKVLDGKQRALTMCSFINGKFALSEKIRIKEIDGVGLVGLTYSELPAEFQERIADYELSIAILRELDAEERATVFFMRNQAVSLTKMDLSLVLLGENAMDVMARLCRHNFMTQKIKLTEPARRKHEDLRIILQYLMLRDKHDTGFSGVEIMSYCDDIKSGEATIDESGVTDVLDYLNAAIREKRQYLKKVHVPIVLYTAQNALYAGISPDAFKFALDNFFFNLPPDDEYAVACKSGSAKRTSVALRTATLGRLIN